jgi:hypothetical protein
MTHGAAAGQRAAEWSRSPFFAATAAAVLPGVTIIVTWRRIKSAAISGNWSFLPEAQRYSIATLRPSTKPASASPFRKAATRLALPSGEPACKNPITGNSCCARAASGHAAAEPPRIVMNSRRFTATPFSQREFPIMVAGLGAVFCIKQIGPHFQASRRVRVRSVHPVTTDMRRVHRLVRFVPTPEVPYHRV